MGNAFMIKDLVEYTRDQIHGTSSRKLKAVIVDFQICDNIKHAIIAVNGEHELVRVKLSNLNHRKGDI